MLADIGDEAAYTARKRERHDRNPSDYYKPPKVYQNREDTKPADTAKGVTKP